MGLGVFSGGVEVSKFLAKQGACVTVTDLKGKKALAASLDRLRGWPITYHLGRHHLSDFTQADTVIVNPAVPLESPYVQAARRQGVCLETEMNLIFKLTRAPLIGITGSNGKSTTTALIGEMFKQAGGKTVVGGNIGKSLINTIARVPANAWVILELLSFQLESLGQIQKSPHIAVVTNLSPNHLDRHKTLRNYYQAKRQILAHQSIHDYAVLNYDDPRVRSWAPHCPGQVYYFSLRKPVPRGTYLDKEKIFFKDKGRTHYVGTTRDIVLPGEHNVQNCLAAITVAQIKQLPRPDIRRVLATFKGIEHRLELVRTYRQVRYFNDSIATTPESVIAALNAFTNRLILIAGGYDKKVSFDEVARLIAGRVAVLILMGDTQHKIARTVERYRKSAQPLVRLATSLAAAVAIAFGQSQPGDVVLLSPACASYDMFNNFVERGRLFKELVRKL